MKMSQTKAYDLLHNPSRQARMEEIINTIMPISCSIYKSRWDQLFSKKRERPFVWYRQSVIYLIKWYYGKKITLVDIGYAIGLDHSTIIHSINTVQDQLDINPTFNEEFKQIQQRFEQRILESSQAKQVSGNGSGRKSNLKRSTEQRRILRNSKAGSFSTRNEKVHRRIVRTYGRRKNGNLTRRPSFASFSKLSNKV